MEKNEIIIVFALSFVAMLVGLVVGGGVLYTLLKGQMETKMVTIEKPVYIERNITTVLNYTLETWVPTTLTSSTSTTSTSSSSTTSSTIKRANMACAYNLYDCNIVYDQNSIGGYYWVNKSYGMKLHAIDGSGGYSEDNYGYHLVSVERADAKLYASEMEWDSSIEGVYRGRPNGTLIRLNADDFKMDANGGML